MKNSIGNGFSRLYRKIPIDWKFPHSLSYLSCKRSFCAPQRSKFWRNCIFRQWMLNSSQEAESNQTHTVENYLDNFHIVWLFGKFLYVLHVISTFQHSATLNSNPSIFFGFKGLIVTEHTVRSVNQRWSLDPKVNIRFDKLSSYLNTHTEFLFRKLHPVSAEILEINFDS